MIIKGVQNTEKYLVTLSEHRPHGTGLLARPLWLLQCCVSECGQTSL